MMTMMMMMMMIMMMMMMMRPLEDSIDFLEFPGLNFNAAGTNRTDPHRPVSPVHVGPSTSGNASPVGGSIYFRLPEIGFNHPKHQPTIQFSSERAQVQTGIVGKPNRKGTGPGSIWRLEWLKGHPIQKKKQGKKTMKNLFWV